MVLIQQLQNALHSGYLEEVENLYHTTIKLSSQPLSQVFQLSRTLVRLGDTAQAVSMMNRYKVEHQQYYGDEESFHCLMLDLHCLVRPFDFKVILKRL